MKLLVLDPGSEQTGFVFYEQGAPRPIDGGFGKINNDQVFGLIDREILSASVEGRNPVVVCEYPQPRGQMMSWQLVDTIEMIGRFHQHGVVNGGSRFEFHRCDRAHVKSYICAGVQRPKDSQIRQALIDRFGGEFTTKGPKCLPCKGSGKTGKGKERVPCESCGGSGEVVAGIFYGVASDVWQALGVAVMYAETKRTIVRVKE
jgi:hypothetical protein